MGIANHGGRIKTVETWNNSHNQLEMKVYGEDSFLWHFSEDDPTGLEKGRFYCPVYETEDRNQVIRKSKHLFYVLVPEDQDGDCVFIEIGPDGYINRGYQSAETLRRDIQDGNLLPMWIAATFGKPPETTLPELKRLA